MEPRRGYLPVRGGIQPMGQCGVRADLDPCRAPEPPARVPPLPQPTVLYSTRIPVGCGTVWGRGSAGIVSG
jgi:hypothetical protein